MLQKNKKGFTLIELLTIIVVISVILLITIPVVLNVVEKARRKAFKESVIQASKKVDAYMVKYNDYEYENREEVTVRQLKKIMKHDFTSGKYIIEDGQKEVWYVTNGKYCAKGLVKNLKISKDCYRLDDTEAKINNEKIHVTSTSKSVRVVIDEEFAEDAESGIKEYRVSLYKENELKEIKIVKTADIVTFDRLTHDTTYKIIVDVINGNDIGLEEENKYEEEIKTKKIDTPTYAVTPEGWSQSKTVIINYQDPENKYTHEYSLDGGEEGTWVLSEGNTETITFNENGTIIARVNDGKNYIDGSSQTISEIDTTPPTISDVTPSTIWDYTNNVTFTATDSESQVAGYNVTGTDSEPTNWIPITNFVEDTTETKYEYNASWAKVFYHNTQAGYTLFSNATEALNTNSNYKYSVLGNLENYINSSGKWEFLLQYPEYSTNQYNRWKQSINPAISTIANGTGLEYATGYEEVDISWTDNYWGGLAKSTSDATLINGSVGHGNWFYAIGSYNKWNAGIPGPNSSAVSIASLWARIDDKTTTTKQIITAKVGDLKENKTYYLWVKDSLGNVKKESFTINRVDNGTLTAPSVSGGDTTWINSSRTFTLTPPQSSSGIKMYEYYVSNSNTAPGKYTGPTGNSTSTSITVSTSGQYVFFRAVNNAGVIGNWTSAQDLYVDTSNYTATFNGNGGSNGTSITKQFGTSLGTLPTTSRTGYTFLGWYTAASGGSQISTSTIMPRGGTTYYAHWSAINYTITVYDYKTDVNGNNASLASTRTITGTINQTSTVNPQSYSGYNKPGSVSVTFPTNTVVKFYHTQNQTVTFTGSNKYPFGTPNIFLWESAGNNYNSIAVHVKWSSATSIPTWTNDNGQDDLVWYETDITPRDSFWIGKYEKWVNIPFDKHGWRNHVYISHVYNGSTFLGGISFRPQITVNYNLNGGSGTSTQQTKYIRQNSTLTLNAAPTKSGWTFLGWQADNGSYFGGSQVVGSQDWSVYDFPGQTNTTVVNLTARWKRNAWNSKT